MQALQTINTLQMTSSELSSRVLNLPGCLGPTFRAFHLAHFWLSCIENVEMAYDHPTLFSAGALLDIFSGDTVWVRRGAQLVLISKTLTKTLEIQGELLKTIENIKDLFYNTFPYPYTLGRTKASSDMVRSPERQYFVRTLATLPQPLFNLVVRIASVLQACFLALYQCLLLSRALLELYESILYDRYVELRAITGIFINGSQILEHLTQNRDALIHDLIQNEETIDRFLTLLNTSYKTRDICTLVEVSEAKLKTARRALEEASLRAKEAAAQVLFSATGHLHGPLVDHLRAPPLVLSLPQKEKDYGNDFSAHSPRQAPAWLS
jgi:hypothetical protein